MVGIRSFPFGARPIFRDYASFREGMTQSDYNRSNMIFLRSGFGKTNLQGFLLLNMVEGHFVDTADHSLLFLSNMGTKTCEEEHLQKVGCIRL